MFLLLPLIFASGILPSFIREGNWRISEMPIHANVATHDQYREIARQINAAMPPDQHIVINFAEFGTFAYYIENRIISKYSDRRWLKPHLEKLMKRSSIHKNLVTMNHYWIEIPMKGPTTPYWIEMASELDGIQNMIIGSWPINSKWSRGKYVVLLKAE